MNAAMITQKNKYSPYYIASFGCEDGMTMDFWFETHKEAVQMIKDMGFEILNKRQFNDEMGGRFYTSLKHMSVYHNYALNG